MQICRIQISSLVKAEVNSLYLWETSKTNFSCVELPIGLPFHSFLREFDLPFNFSSLGFCMKENNQGLNVKQSCRAVLKSKVVLVLSWAVLSLPFIQALSSLREA